MNAGVNVAVTGDDDTLFTLLPSGPARHAFARVKTKDAPSTSAPRR